MNKTKRQTILLGLLTAYGVLTWINSQTNLLFLSVICTLLWCLGYVFISKQPKFQLTSQVKLMTFLFTVMILGWTNLTIDRPLGFLVQPYSISIVPSPDQPSDSTHIQISQISVDNQNLDLATLTSENGWEYKETLVTPSTDPNPLTLSNLKNELINVSFLKTNQSGNVSIYKNNQLFKTINLSSSTEQEIKVKLSPDYPIILSFAYAGVFIAFYLSFQFLVSRFILTQNSYLTRLKEKLKLPTEALTSWTIIYFSLPLLFITLFKFIGLRNVQSRSILLILFFILMVGSEIILFKKCKVKNAPSSIKRIRGLFYLMLTSILSVLGMQIIYFFPNFDVTITWIAHHINLIFLTSTLVFSLNTILYALFNNLILGISLSCLLTLIAGIANYYKMLVVGEPIYPSDMSMLGNMDDIIGYVKNILSLSLLITLIGAIAVLLIVSFLFRKGFKLNWKYRTLFLIGGTTYLFLTFNYEKTIMKPIVESTINFSKWNQLSNYQQNGFLFGFITNLQNDLMIKNETYSEATLREITDYYTEKANAYNASIEQGITPNMITIVSESLSDPTVFNQLTFSEDPLPNLKAYQNTYSSGRFLSPFKGNRTANVEFEYLMSFTNSLLLEGTVPFQQALSHKTEIPSFVSFLGQLGYSSVAIHPNNAAFYKRSVVYPALGFNEFLSIDKMQNLEYIESQKYVTDESVFNELYQELESAEDPIFAYGLTMANHIAIFENKFGEPSIQVTDVEGNPNREMEIYAEGLKQTDAALKEFITKIENYEEPTVVIFFGDHLINFQSDIHAKHGYIDKDTDAQRAKMFYETPLLIMSNIDDFAIEDLNSISPIFLAPLILQELKMPLSPFHLLLLDLYEEFSVLHNNFKIDRNQNQVDELTQRQQELLLALELIQYDILEGQEYSLHSFFSVPQQ